jgi:protein-S-isoprenylcysteine O-methyltransferase Ste14
MHRLELKIPPVVVVALLAVAMWGIARSSFTVDPAPWLRIGLAALLLVKGAWMALAGVLEFRRASTTVNPMRPDESSAVVDTGIYRHTRNPMYLGFAFVLLAWAVWLASPWSLLGPVAYVAWMTRFQIRPEERALAERFGEPYREYCRRVRRWV